MSFMLFSSLQPDACTFPLSLAHLHVERNRSVVVGLDSELSLCVPKAAYENLKARSYYHSGGHLLAAMTCLTPPVAPCLATLTVGE